MLDNIEPIIRDAVMKILSAIFETGFVDEVNLSVVCELFGAKVEDDRDIIINFKDPRWVKEYVLFSQPEGEDFEMKMIDMESGEVTLGTISREELEDLMDESEELPEDVSVEDLNPDRIIH